MQKPAVYMHRNVFLSFSSLSETDMVDNEQDTTSEPIALN